jgi:hypothetical protein
VPKLSKVEACILCEALPCECSPTRRPKKSPSPKPRIQPDAPVSVSRASDMRDRMRAAAAEMPKSLPAAGPRQPAKVDDALPQLPSSPDETLVMTMAIRNLAPILHPDELEEFSVVLGSQPSPTERAAFWRAGQASS